MFFPTSGTKAQHSLFSLNIKHAWISAYEREPARFCYLLVLKIISSGRRTTVVLHFGVAQNHPLKFLRMSDPFTTAIKSVIIATFCSPPKHAYTYTCHKLTPPFPLSSPCLFPLQSRWWKEQMVCSADGVGSTKSSVRSFTPHPCDATALGCVAANMLDRNTRQTLAGCKICHFWYEVPIKVDPKRMKQLLV